MTIIDSRALTEPQREDFIDGWKDAGGYMGDCEADCPWCSPWEYGKDIELFDDNYYDAGRAYWEAVKSEVLMTAQ